MNKRLLLLLLIIGCFFAIYSFKNYTKAPAAPEEAVPLAEEPMIPAQDHIEKPKEVEAQKPTSKYSEATLKKIKTLKEILTSKNDNDPRLDTELKNLSDEDKDALVGMYQDMKPESLNDKGTVAFLIGRDLTRPEDAEFLKNVLSEEPCLSLDNCGITNGQTDPHLDSINNVTLNYPQVVALNRIKSYIQTHDPQNMNPTILAQLADAIKIGQSSKVPMVQNRSKEIANLLTTDLTNPKK